MVSSSLAAAFSLGIYLSRICFRRPNPPPKQRHDRDTILLLSKLPDAREYIFLALGIAHTITTLKFRPSSSGICPNPAVLNAKYFTWSSYTKIWLALIYVAGALRVAAFRSLGTTFTFELAQPQKLITSGLYHYMQHPSYLPDGIITLANCALFANLDGYVGTFLPEDLVRWWVRSKTLWLTAVALVWIAIIRTRIVEEEEMLRRAFGKEHEEYSRKTARFIPWVI